MTPDWERRQAALHDLIVVLRCPYRVLVTARVLCEANADLRDQFRRELKRSIAQTVMLGRLVATMLAQPVYRPIAQSWQGSGLNVWLRPDFVAMGIGKPRR